MNNIFGKTLKSLRSSRNISQDELAEIMNTTRVSISNYETGRRVPEIDFISQLADYFNVTLDYLFGRETPSYDPNAGENKQLIERFNKLSPEEKKHISLEIDFLLSEHKKTNKHFLTEKNLNHISMEIDFLLSKQNNK